MKRALLGLLCAAPALGAQERLRVAEVELVGPLETVRLDLGAEGGTLVSIPLSAGETRTLEIPLPASSGSPDPIVGVAPLGSGRARFVGWGPDEARRARWEALPPGLRARPRVMALPDGVHPSVAGLLLAAALSLIVWSQRRRPKLALAIACVGSTGLLWFAWNSDSLARRMWIFEGQAASELWLQVITQHDGIDAPIDGPVLSFEVDPPRAPVWFHFTSPAHLSRIDALGALARTFRPLELPGRTLTRQINGWDDLEQVWLRESDGTWSFHGRWERGDPLPPAESGIGSMPPGWMQPGLPQGTSILIAELPDPEHSGTSEVAWVRLFGI